jgi:biopolymer transport protein ExbB
MLQESTQAAAATGGNAAAALTQMGVDHLLGEMTSNPGAYAVSWAVLITLTIMSAMSIYWIVINFFKNVSLRRSADRVVSSFWETPNAQDAIRFMEEQKKSEPFSKIALDAAQAAAHHQRHEGSRLVESLNRSEFVDRALRQAVTRESMNLESGLTVLATVGSTAPFVGLFGTVLGIMFSFSRIAQEKNTSLDVVAPGIAEALFATAIGLFAAIPAVIAYNRFSYGINRLEAKLQRFADGFHGTLSRELEMES